MAQRDSSGRFVSGGSGVSVSVESRDTGLAALEARLLKAAQERVMTVGIHEEEGAGSHGEDGLSIADLGAIHEFGLGGMPVRSFIGAYAEGKEPEHRQNMTKMGEALVKGTLSDPAKGMAQLGVQYVGEVQQRMAAGLGEPSRTLIETNLLRSSIASRVE